MTQDLFSKLFKILCEFFNSKVSLFFFSLKHGISFMFQICFSVVQFFLTLSSRFFVHLVFAVTFVEIKTAVVEDLRVVFILTLHAFL